MRRSLSDVAGAWRISALSRARTALLWTLVIVLLVSAVGVAEGRARLPGAAAAAGGAGAAVGALDNCMTLQTEILVHKEKIYDYNGRRVRLICAGNVLINKCEGYCLSQMSPSVVQFPGFKKVCGF